MRWHGDADEHDALTEVRSMSARAGVAADIAEPATVRGFTQEVAPHLR